MHVPLESGVLLLLGLLDAVAVSLGVVVVGGMVLALGHCSYTLKQKRIDMETESMRETNRSMKRCWKGRMKGDS